MEDQSPNTSSALLSADTDDANNLYPPAVRQAYTPPPKTADGLEAEEEGRPCRSANSHTNGSVEMKKMRVERMEDLALCASPAGFERSTGAGNTTRRRREGVKSSSVESESLAGMLRKGIVEHQLGLSLNLMLLLAMSWCIFPSLRHRLDAFCWLSYGRTGLGTETMYGQGPRDLCLVVGFVVFFTGVRAFMLDYVLTPLAGILGVGSRKGRVRFAEQSYLLLYYILYWNWGLYLFVRDTPSSLLPAASHESQLTQLLISLWTQFPRLYFDAGMKAYYLSQLAFWIQQILVIHLEEKRKDHYQMLTHHFVTVALMSTSYGDRQWRVGNAILVCMDVVDLVFPLAKILKYIGWQKACDACFALFVLAWVVARHVAYLIICWSVYAHLHNVATSFGTYSLTKSEPDRPNIALKLSDDGGSEVWKNVFQPFWDPGAETVQFNAPIKYGFLGLLLGLQCITLMWLVMICRVIAKVLRGEGADDSRSDDECDTPVSTSPSTIEKKAFIEVEAEASDLSYSNYSGPRRVGSGSRRLKSKGGSGGFASGLHLGDRKDLLNRIGCLSEEQLSREREKLGESRPGTANSNR